VHAAAASRRQGKDDPTGGPAGPPDRQVAGRCVLVTVRAGGCTYAVRRVAGKILKMVARGCLPPGFRGHRRGR